MAAEKVKEVDKEKLKELKAKHGKLFCTVSAGQEFVFRRASPEEFEHWNARISEPKDRLDAMRQLCVDCIVLPEEKELDRVFTELPMLPMSLGARIAEKGGLVEASEVKEL